MANSLCVDLKVITNNDLYRKIQHSIAVIERAINEYKYA